MKLAAPLLFVTTLAAAAPTRLAIPATWLTVDPRMKALFPHGDVLRATERVRWGAVTIRDYELAVTLDKVDLEVERLTDIARASGLIPTFRPHGVMQMSGPGITIDVKATPESGSIEVRYSLDDKAVPLATALASHPTCAAMTALSKKGAPRVYEYTQAVDTPLKHTLTVKVGKTDQTASCP